MNYDQGGLMPTSIGLTKGRSSDRNGASDSPPQQIRLMVVDDHPAVRLGLLHLLEGQYDFSVDAVGINAQSAVAQAEAKRIDVAVVDYQLGGRNGLWVCRRLKRLPESPRVIIFSAFANDHLAACCAVAEADAMLNKGVLGSDLCDAVRSVARGRRLLPRVPQPLADMLRRRLGEREQMLFGMLLTGIPRTEIGRIIGISLREIESREDAMLRTLERLPGELSASSLAGDRGGLDRPISARRTFDRFAGRRVGRTKLPADLMRGS
jgi:DNA-binding NarL/FixJ family response regulator